MPCQPGNKRRGPHFYQPTPSLTPQLLSVTIQRLPQTGLPPTHKVRGHVCLKRQPSLALLTAPNPAHRLSPVLFANTFPSILTVSPACQLHRCSPPFPSSFPMALALEAIYMFSLPWRVPGPLCLCVLQCLVPRSALRRSLERAEGKI